MNNPCYAAEFSPCSSPPPLKVFGSPMIRTLTSLILLSIALASNSYAAPTYVPPSLADWAQWIRSRNSSWECAAGKDDKRNCEFPSELAYTVTTKGASFILTGELLAPGEVPIPGSSQAVPINIILEPDGYLHEQDGNLFVKLPAGPFTIKGEFPHLGNASVLPVPETVGLVSMEPVAEETTVSRRDGTIRLDERSTAHNLDSLVLSVSRRLTDGSPMQLETLIHLSVSGRSRMVTLGSVLPRDALPVELNSPLPAQVTSEGVLSLQARQGQHTIAVTSVLPATTASLSFQGAHNGAWPTTETFAFSARPVFRSLHLTGGESLHAEAATIPSEWRQDAVFTIKSDATINLEEVSRGEQNSPLPQLNLQRELWLSFDGTTMSQQDQLMGTVGRANRLNVLPGNEIGRVVSNGSPVLITKAPGSDLRGVEVREQQVYLTAIGTQSFDKPLLAHGWDATMASVQGVLNLPPAWQLIAIGGASAVSGAWIDSWSLLDLFICILIIVASRTIVSTKAAVILAFMLVLTHGEFLAPKMLIVHLLILLAWRYTISVKESIWDRLNKALLVATCAAWVLQALTFGKLQLTQMLFPQLQAGTRYRTIIQQLALSVDTSITVWPLMLVALGAVVVALYYISRGTSTRSYVLRTIGMLFLLSCTIPLVLGLVVFSTVAEYPQSAPAPGARAIEEARSYNSLSSADSLQKGDENITTQNHTFFENKNLAAGPAIPTWRWKQYRFWVPGPVSPSSTLQIVALSPLWTRVLSALRIVIITLLALILLRRVRMALSVVLLVVMLSYGEPARAEFPPHDMLQELETQLRGEICSGAECSTAESLLLSMEDGILSFSMDVSSQGRTARLLPGPISTFLPISVTVDDQPAGLRRDETDHLMVLVPNGRHQIKVTLSFPPGDSFTLAVPAPLPLYTTVRAPGWTYSGVTIAGTAQNSIEFNRISKDEQTTIRPSLLGNWVAVSRTLVLAEQYSVATVVRRIGDASKPLVVQVPLLDQERILSGAVEPSGKVVKIEFPAGQSEVSYNSSLPVAGSLTLTSPNVPHFTEDWRVQCSPLLHCLISGVPYQVLDQPVFTPFPGESLAIAIAPLESLTGEPLSIDEVSHSIRWTSSLVSGTVQATTRVTQQSSLMVSAPANTTIQSVTMDGMTTGSKVTDARTAIALPPGNHTVIVAYELAKDPAITFTVPSLALSAPSSNIAVTVAPSSDRWIVWTGGGLFGPSVVYWGKLIGVVALCVTLAIIGMVKLSPGSAAFLGVGLSSLPMITLWIPLLWLGLLEKSSALTPRQASQRWAIITATALLAIYSLFLLYHVVEIGLLLDPPLLIAGANSTPNQLRWIYDSTLGALTSPWIISLPMWAWRGFSLVWATWLVVGVIRWIKETISAIKTFSSGQ